ncbi:MAG: DNA replication/repair protein RecF [Arenimonas sp.]
MQLIELRIKDLRCVQQAELLLSPGINLITGANGAGKTSVIEAIHLMGYGRSFRGRVRDGMIRSGANQCEVFIRWLERRPGERHAGLLHTGNTWQAKLNGQSTNSLTELCAEIPIVTFEPGSHELISGGAEHRRRYMDWGLFHVEHEFVQQWRRYARALKQRNILLKSQANTGMLNPWEREMALSGEIISRYRAQYLEQLDLELNTTANRYLPELGRALLTFSPGWKRSELSLQDALTLSRQRDLATGNTGVGPHRADWRVGYENLPNKETLSRGQEKLTALACVMAQAENYAHQKSEWPVVCMDDLASELDVGHQAQVLSHLSESRAQVILTATEAPAILENKLQVDARFHVKHGFVTTV